MQSYPALLALRRSVFSMRNLILPAVLCVFAQFAVAQSPQTATLVVLVPDSTGAAIRDAKVSITNAATGAVRDTVSGNDGTAAFQALSLTGSYAATITKEGFGNEELKDITLRA